MKTAHPRKKAPRRRAFSPIVGIVVMLGAMMLTTLAIEASDSFRIPKFGMFAGVGATGEKERCPTGMVFVSGDNGGFCIDRYEESPSSTCTHDDPLNQFETNDNITDSTCVGVSEKEREPWVNIDLHQAMSICAKAGKHLATPEEWYRAALGTPDRVTKDTADCALGRVGSTHAEKTGARENCVSSYGAYDMVGNVWEWVDASVKEGKYKDIDLPDEGYVASADADGIPTKTATSFDVRFGGDHFFADHTGSRGMFRGGFWGMDEKAGMFTVNASIPTEFVGIAVGFRCAQ